MPPKPAVASAASVPLEFIANPGRARTALHPLRLKLLEALGDADATATALADRLGLPRQTVNYHLGRLAHERLVRAVDQGRVGRRIDRTYRLSARSYLIAPSALAGVATEPERIGDKLSSAYLAAVTARAQEDLAALRQAADRAGKRLPTFTLEADIRFASPADQQAFAEDLSQAFAGLVARHHRPSAEEGRTFRFFVGGHPAVPDRPRPRGGSR